MNKPFLLLFLTFLLPFSAMAEPAELTLARSTYETKLATPKAKLDAALAARGKQYAVVIKALEDRASLDGKLDAVVLLKAEREAYEQGKPTQGFGANAAKVSPEARAARKLLESDVTSIRSAAAPDGRRIASEYMAQLDAVERKLTSQKDLAGALEARKERTSIQQDGADPFASGAAQISKLHRDLLNTTWRWWQGETLTFLAGGKARWSARGTPFTWKVTDPAQRLVEGLMWDGRKYSITFDADLSGGTIVEETAGKRRTQPMSK